MFKTVISTVGAHPLQHIKRSSSSLFINLASNQACITAPNSVPTLTFPTSTSRTRLSFINHFRHCTHFRSVIYIVFSPFLCLFLCPLFTLFLNLLVFFFIPNHTPSLLNLILLLPRFHHFFILCFVPSSCSLDLHQFSGVQNCHTTCAGLFFLFSCSPVTKFQAVLSYFLFVIRQAECAQASLGASVLFWTNNLSGSL